MKKTLSNILFLSDWFAKIQPYKNLLLFRYSLYFFLLFKILWLLPVFSDLMSIYNISPGKSVDPFYLITDPILQLVGNSISEKIFISVCLLIICAAIWKKHKIALSVLVFIISLCFNEILTPLINGGDRMHCLLLFVNIFFITNKNLITSELRKNIGNFFLYGIQLHICLFYFISGADKILDPLWRNGEALISISQLSNYSTNGMQNFMNIKLAVILSWAAIIFELSFGILIWMKKTKTIILFIGLVFHLFIGVFLSLPDFSLVMIISYLLFVPADFFKTENLKTKKPAFSSGLFVPNN